MKIVRPGDIISNQFEAMNIDWQLGGENQADGLLTHGELEVYIDELESKRARRYSGDDPVVIDIDLRDARRLLDAMKAAGADAIDYLPEKLEGFPEHLRRLATEILMKDDEDAIGEINQLILDLARMRYQEMTEVSAHHRRKKEIMLKYIDELAGKLGLR